MEGLTMGRSDLLLMWAARGSVGGGNNDGPEPSSPLRSYVLAMAGDGVSILSAMGVPDSLYAYPRIEGAF